MKVSTTIQVTLVLTAEEAEWLHGVMQNPLSEDCNPANEDPYDKEMRKTFYEATAIEGHNHGS